MKLSKLQVYYPPMCCSSGCESDANPELARFASDLDWLRQQGVEVERYNLSSHPAAFAQNEAVRATLKGEGNDCLPLIVVNDSIVSKRIYPSRNDLVKLCGIDSEKVKAEVTRAEASSLEPESETSACGSGCNCGSPSGSKRMKAMVSLIVLLVIGGIFAYKASSPNQKASNDPAAVKALVFSIPQAPPETAPEEPAQPSTDMKQKKVGENADSEALLDAEKNLEAPDPSVVDGESVTEVQLKRQTGPEEQSAKAGQKIGEYLESLSALNNVAVNQDAVFVFIPNPKGQLADDKTNAAVIAAQQTLKSKKITIGLYTLQTSSPDYSGISSQIQAPAILVACKGKGMAAVSGDVTKTKLLQAFVASSSGGGCGPSGCGPSGAGCK